MGIASLSSHRKVLSNAKDSLVDKLTSAAGTAAVIVEVTQGMQAGQKRRLTLSTMSVGAKFGSDVVLMDADVADGHARISFERSAFGMLAQVEAIDAPVSINGTPVVRGTTLPDVTLPFEMKIGSAQLRFQRPATMASLLEDEDEIEQQPASLVETQNAVKAKAAPLDIERADAPEVRQPAPRPKRRRLLVDPVLALSVLGLFLILVGGIFWHLVNSRSNYVIDVNSPSVAEVVPQKSDVTWAAETRERIAALGLDEVLRVDVLSSRILQTTGLVPEPQMAAYRELQGWFDAQSNAPSMVWDITKRTPLAELPNIGMIRFSEPPAVVLASGDLVGVGDVLIDGWVLASVDERILNIKRGTETQQIEFRAEVE